MLNQLAFERNFSSWTSGRNIAYHFGYCVVDNGRQQFHACIPQSMRALVFFLHATGNDALYPNISLFKHLLDHHIGILSVDLPGHGRHSESRLDAGVLPIFFKSCAQHIQKFRQSPPAELPVFAIAESLGAVLMVEQQCGPSPLPLAGLLAIAMPLQPPTLSSFIRELRSPFLREFYRHFDTYNAYELLPSLLAFKRHLYPIRLPITEKSNYVKVVCDLIAKASIAEKLHRLPHPSLLIYGEHDRIGLPPTHQISDIDIVSLDNQTHFTLMLSRQTAESCRQWIDRQLVKNKEP